MGHKIFISYKYADNNVKKITNNKEEDTVRDYVDKLQEYIDKESDDINKGESDGEDLSSLTDNQIWTLLKNRIYDSSLTIVMISPNMREQKKDRNQWIPWEISYSLKEVSRKNKAGNDVTSNTNAVIALVLPDKNGSYEYYIKNNFCCKSRCRTLYTGKLFQILRDNMFNIKEPDDYICDEGTQVYNGDSSYILSVKWKDFIDDPQKYIDKAYYLQNSIEKYNITKEINDN